MRKKYPLIYLLVLTSTATYGEETGQTGVAGEAAPSVVVAASRTDQRRLDTAARTVIGHDELLHYGDQSLADALKRVPGVTISGVQGRGGEIRMRGLGNGYTQILLNGQAVPSGFSIETISPELIERVEVLRVASAELGTQAIAGTINIVLRKSVAPARREVKFAVSANQGRPSENIAAQLSGETPDASYTVAAVLADNRSINDSSIEEIGTLKSGATSLSRLTHGREETSQRFLNITPRVTWALGGGDALVWQSFIRLLHQDLNAQSDEATIVGASSQFPRNHGHFSAHAETVRSDLQWTRKLGNGAKWDINLGGNHFQRKSTNIFSAVDTIGDQAGARRVNSSATEDGFALAGKYSWSLGSEHTAVAGWDVAHGQRTESRQEHSSFTGDAVAFSDESYAARFDRLAMFAQDDWTITSRWSLSSGLRWEGLLIRTQSNVLDDVVRRSALPSPILQSLYKVSAAGQLRLALSRTFKAPTMFQLAQRRYTSDNNNNPTNPDARGNPHLKPERAWGLDIAYEHYWGKAAMFSAGLFARRINDVIVDGLVREGARWVGMPSNDGLASTRGIELETKFPLQTVWAGAPGAEVRANLARNWSRVDQVGGPDNRLANQVPLSASVGIDHHMRGMPVSLGANLSFQAGGAARASPQTTSWIGTKRELELIGTWRSSSTRAC